MNKEPIISLCMIVKDEAEILEKCIEHVKGIVDEFIIVDTGSTDGTQEIIKRYGKLHEIPFEDYVTTKNKALDLATGRYILWMDADEILYEGADILRIHAEEGQHDAINCRITEGPANNYGIVGNQYDRARLWKRGMYRFVGPGVHEVAAGPAIPMKDRRISVRHEHLKKNKASTSRERFEQYVAILKKAIENGNELHRAWFYLGRTYMDLGQSLDAISAYMKYLQLPHNGFKDERWQACYDIAACYKSNGEYNHAREWLRKARGIDSRRAEADCLLGDIAFREQDYETAIDKYRMAIHGIPDDVILFLHPQAYSSYPIDQLVLCHYYLGQFDQASAMCRMLVSNTGGRDQRILNNMWWCHSKERSVTFMTLGQTPEPIYGGMIENTGVGGVETTYLELSEELAAMGQDVFLFCTTDKAHIHKGVYYIPWQEIDAYWGLQPDIIISSRWFDPFYVEDKSKKIIWFQDAFFGLPDNHPDLFNRAHAVICSSPWHRDYICERLERGIAPDKLRVIPLGIRKDLFEGIAERDPNKIIYSSNPDRGLEHLIDMWDEICKALPDIKLTVTYGWEGLKTWSDNAAWHDGIQSLQQKCFAKAEQYGNIHFTGRITKRELAKEMMTSSVLAYPNNFRETFCLTALEAQMAGLSIITTNIGALPHVISQKRNFLIEGSPRSAEYQKQFIKHLIDLMTNPKDSQARSKGNRNASIDALCDWSDIAKVWRHLLFELRDDNAANHRNHHQRPS